MRRLLTVLAASWLGFVSAHAAPLQVSGPPASGPNSTITSLNGLTTPLSPAQGGSGIVYNTGAYGAICDGSHHYLAGVTSVDVKNTVYLTAGWTLSQWQALFPTLPSGANLSTSELDGLAISATFADAYNASTKPFNLKVNGSFCYASQSINFTGLVRKGVFLDLSGVEIYSTAAGVPALDLIGSSFYILNHPFIVGDATNEPYSGIRYGRSLAGQNGNNITIISPRTAGSFTRAGRDVVDSEVLSVIAPNDDNHDTSGNAFAVSRDGANHWNAAASEAILANGQPFQTITTPQDTDEPFNGTTEIGGQEDCYTCVAVEFESGAHGMSIIGQYIDNASTLATKYGVEIYESATAYESDVDWRALKVEGSGSALTSTFYLTGSTPTPTLTKFQYSPAVDSSSVAMISTDPALTAVSLPNAEFDIANFAYGNSISVFDNPSIYSGSGHVEVPAQTNWPFAKWTGGSICVSIQCTPIVPTLTINRNSEFDRDAPFEFAQTPAAPGNLNPVTDGWLALQYGGTAGKATYQDLPGPSTACNGGRFIERMSVTTAYTVAASNTFGLRSSFDGGILGQLGWGGANAQPLTVDLWARSTVSSEVATFSLTDPGNINTYAHAFTLPATPNTCQEYIFQIPGWTSTGSFGESAGAIGARVNVVLDCDTTYQVTPEQWSVTSNNPGPCATSTTHFLSTVGNQFSVGPVRIYAGFYPQLFQARTADAAYVENSRYFQKSPPIGTARVSGSYANTGQAGTAAATVVVAGVGTVSGTVRFSPPMFGSTASGSTVPSVTPFSPGAATTNCYNPRRAADAGAATITNISTTGFEFTCATTASEVAGDIVLMGFTAQQTQ